MGSAHTWFQPIASFTVALHAARRSPGTVRLYRKYLISLARESGIGPWEATTADLRAWLACQDWKPETAKSARTAVRAFYHWAHGEGHIDVDPALGLEPIRIPPSSPRPAPEDVVAQITTHPDERIRHMAMLAAYAGLRAAEIAQVHADDVVGDLVGVTLRVHGKGGKARTVPVAFEPLAGWLVTLEGYAFPSVDANGTARPHLSAGHVSRLLSEALPRGWTAHTLRHRLATRAYAGTRDLLAVGAVLGHSRPETTRRYVLLPDDATRQAVLAAA